MNFYDEHINKWGREESVISIQEYRDLLTKIHNVGMRDEDVASYMEWASDKLLLAGRVWGNKKIASIPPLVLTKELKPLLHGYNIEAPSREDLAFIINQCFYMSEICKAFAGVFDKDGFSLEGFIARHVRPKLENFNVGTLVNRGTKDGKVHFQLQLHLNQAVNSYQPMSLRVSHFEYRQTLSYYYEHNMIMVGNINPSIIPKGQTKRYEISDVNLLDGLDGPDAEILMNRILTEFGP